MFKIFVNVTGSQGAGNGGLGGWVQASLSVKGGDLLYISVGCRDGDFNGGGDCGNSYGGGASDIRTSLSDLKTRLVVAGGGGGSSQSRDIAGSGGKLMRISFAPFGPGLFLHLIIPKYDTETKSFCRDSPRVYSLSLHCFRPF